MTKKKFIIDADTGSDDAVAILMALRDPRVEVLLELQLFLAMFLLNTGNYKHTRYSSAMRYRS